MRKAFLLFILLLSIPAVSQAQSVDILWQSETYAPPFYKGRSLWTTQSRIIFVAIPQGLGNPANLNYKWTRNGTVLGDISGVGRNSLSFTDSILSRPQSIMVEIISSNDTVLASSTVAVAPIAPTLAIYENNPLYGFMFHKEIGEGLRLQAREIAFTAFPFFFSTPSRTHSSMTYEWRTNTGVTDNGNSVTYRTQDDAAGAAGVRVRAGSASAITQSVDRNFSIQFEN